MTNGVSFPLTCSGGIITSEVVSHVYQVETEIHEIAGVPVVVPIDI